MKIVSDNEDNLTPKQIELLRLVKDNGEVNKKDSYSDVWREMLEKIDMLIESMNGPRAYLYINTDEYNNLMDRLVLSRGRLIDFMLKFYDFSAENC